MKKLILINTFAILFAGCTTSGTRVDRKIGKETTNYRTNGTIESVTREGVREWTRARGLAFWDAQNKLEKLRAGQTGKGQTIGLQGVEQEATSTNLVGELKEARELLGVILKR